MGTLQHIQREVNHPFGIKLEIPPLAKCIFIYFIKFINVDDPNTSGSGSGLGVFTLGNVSRTESGLTFTLPSTQPVM